jgi:hypothetical protein
MSTNWTVSFSQQELDEMTVDLESLQNYLNQFFAARERGEVSPHIINAILQIANRLIDLYDD